MQNGKLVGIPDSFKASKDDMTHTHEDGTTHSHEGGDESHHHHEDGTTHDHEGGDQPHHHHEDGTMHDHEGGDQPHTHDEETPNFEKMTKKALGEWAVDNGISVDSKKTKAKMIEEIKEQL